MTGPVVRSCLNVTIDRLVLAGIPRASRDVVVSAFKAELSRLAASSNCRFAESRTGASMTFSIEPTGSGGSPQGIGTEAARRLFMNLGQPEGTPPGPVRASDR